MTEGGEEAGTAAEELLKAAQAGDVRVVEELVRREGGRRSST